MSNEEIDLDSARVIRDNVASILKMPAFLAWKARQEGQIDLRMLQNLRPLSELKDPEYEKGYVAGMMHSVRGWELLQEEMELLVKQKLEDEEDE